MQLARKMGLLRLGEFWGTHGQGALTLPWPRSSPEPLKRVEDPQESTSCSPSCWGAGHLGCPPCLPPPMAGNFPTTKDKDELRGRPRQCWDNEALCFQNQSRGRRAKGRWGPCCLHTGKPCLPGPHPDPLPSWVQGDPGQKPVWPTQGGRHWVRQTDNARPLMVPLCRDPPQDRRKEPLLVPASC